MVNFNFTKEQKLEIYDKAVELFDNGKKWINGHWFTDGGKYQANNETQCMCLQGAICAAAVELGYLDGDQATRETAEQISKVIVIDGDEIPTLNDHYEEWKDFSKHLPTIRRKIVEEESISFYVMSATDEIEWEDE